MNRGLFRYAGVLAVAAALLIGGRVLPEFYMTLLNYIGLYALVALGLVLLTGVSGNTWENSSVT